MVLAGWIALACAEGDKDGAVEDSATAGSEDTGDATTLTGTTLQEVQDQVFTPSCALSYCHDTDAVDRPRLVEGLAWGDLVGQPSSQLPGPILVVPGQPTNSYVVMKLNGVAGIYGAPMPYGGDLHPTLITLVEKWISDGALDN